MALAQQLDYDKRDITLALHMAGGLKLDDIVRMPSEAARSIGRADRRIIMPRRRLGAELKVIGSSDAGSG